MTSGVPNVQTAILCIVSKGHWDTISSECHDMQYHWQISPPEQSLRCSIANSRADKQIFSAWISLQRRELTAQWKRNWLIRQPWQNVQVVLRIYWHALKLYFKGIPVHGHPKTKDKNA